MVVPLIDQNRRKNFAQLPVFARIDQKISLFFGLFVRYATIDQKITDFFVYSGWCRMSPKYRDLRTLFHISENDARIVHEQRFNSKDAVRLNFQISGNQAFYVMDSAIYELIIKAMELDRDIDRTIGMLPQRAIEQYMDKCLIDEIVLTNGIEGVHSTRREIDDALEMLAEKDKTGRFLGIVEKYHALRVRKTIPIATCADVRALYDELVLDEVRADDPSHVPDGQFFRKGPVSVLDASHKPIHQGVEPESKIIELMNQALMILADEAIPALVRVSVFHFLFAYIHPFYDGNGRTNRFISSYVLSHSFSPIVGYRLSYSVKERIEKYYKGFSICEHPLNKGDITPFVISFSELVVDAMESMLDSLQAKQSDLADAVGAVNRAIVTKEEDAGLWRVAFILAQAELFSENGATTEELCAAAEMSEPTMAKKRKLIKELGFLRETRKGRQRFYSLNLQKMG
jgi:Fic family protein